MAALPDSVPVDKLESLLTCSICLETLIDPRTLPCFHSFCKCCLEKFVKKQREKAVTKEIEDFDCPTCRSVFTLKPKEEVEGMSGSHFIRNMLEVMAMQRQAKVAKCSRCAGAATRRCVTCEVFVCEECFAVHESWPGFNKHSVLTINELTLPENQGRLREKLHCKEHKEKKLKFYCETCKELICRYCMDFNHIRPDHSCFPIEKIAAEHKEALKSSFSILNEKLVKGNETLQSILNARQALKEDATRAKDEIIKQKEELKEAILEKVEEMAKVKVDKVDEVYNKVDERLAMFENDMKSFVEKMNGSVALSQNLIERGSNEEMLSFQKIIEESVEKAEKKHPEKLQQCVNPNGKIQYKRMPIDYGHLAEFLNTVGIVVDITTLSYCSIILKDKDEYVCQMVEWLKDHDFKWNLCYRASRDGWKAEDFHAHCDNKEPTVTLVKVDDYIFGGFTDQNWEGQGYKSSTSSFLFSLKNKDNLPPFKAIIENTTTAIFANSTSGPTFGNGYGKNPDVYIASEAHINRESYSNFGKAYKLPEGYVRSTKSSSCLLAGFIDFKPTEIEVFY